MHEKLRDTNRVDRILFIGFGILCKVNKISNKKWINRSSSWLKKKE